MDPARARKRWLRFFLGIAILGAVVALLLSGVTEDLSPASIRGHLLDSGPWGPALFVLAFAALQPFGLSAHVFIVGAALVWPPLVAMTLSWAGAVLAGCTSFGFARFMGREWVQARLPERVRRYDERLATHGFRTVLVMRLLLFTFGPMQLMFGVSRVRFVPFVLASAIGLLPMIAVASFVGAGVVEWLFG